MSTALTLHSQRTAVAVVPPSVQEAAALIQNPELPAVAAYLPDELSACLVLPITGVAFLLGHKNSLKSADDLELLATALARVVKRRFAGFKLAEVTEALQRGASGEYRRKPDELLLPSLDHFTHWLSCYQQGCRAAALRVLAQAADAEQKRLPQPTYEQDLPAAVAQLAHQVKSLGYFPSPLDGGNLAYEWLKRIGAFSGFKTQEQYAEMMRKESIALTRQRSADKSERKQIGSFAVLLRRGWPEQHPMANTVRNNCKKRLLREWIRYHVARGTDLHTWLTNLAQTSKAA